MTELFKNLPETIKQIDTTLKFFGGFVCLAVGGLLVVAFSSTGAIQWAALIGTFVVACLGITLVTLMAVKYPNTLSNGSALTLPEALCGQWWQVVFGDEQNAISHVTIFSSGGNVRLNGLTYTFVGAAPERSASWHSTATAVVVKGHDEFEIYYFWQGDVDLKSAPEQGVMGVGYYRLINSGGESASGEGWFTAGDLKQFTPDKRRKVDFLKLTADEVKSIGENPKANEQVVSELAHRAYLSRMPKSAAQVTRESVSSP